MSREATTTPDRSRGARERCRRALNQLHTGQGDAAATIGQTLTADPGCVPAYCLRAALLVMTGQQDGDLKRALQLYGGIVEDDPHDMLALRVAHLGDLHWGRSAQLRDRVAAVLPSWRADGPGDAYVLGMHAFGLAELDERLARRPGSVLDELPGARIASRAPRSAPTPTPRPTSPAPLVAECRA